MRCRKLRIAWSVVWGLAIVLLIVLWVRSYWWEDTIIAHHSSSIIGVTTSPCGEFSFAFGGMQLPNLLNWYSNSIRE